MINVTRYLCSVCGSEYADAEHAERCEAMGLPALVVAEVGQDLTYTQQETGEERTGRVGAIYPVKMTSVKGEPLHTYAYVVPEGEGWRLALPLTDGGLVSADSFGLFGPSYIAEMTAHYQAYGLPFQVENAPAA